MNCGVVLRHGSDPVRLWLCLWLAAVTPISPLAWELPYATGAALKKQKKKKKKRIFVSSTICQPSKYPTMRAFKWLQLSVGVGQGLFVSRGTWPATSHQTSGPSSCSVSLWETNDQNILSPPALTQPPIPP